MIMLWDKNNVQWKRFGNKFGHIYSYNRKDSYILIHFACLISKKFNINKKYFVMGHVVFD
jgi:hypothetical protein